MSNSITKGFLIGEAALHGLSTRGNLEVLAATSRAIYLRSDEEIFWILEQEAPMHRRCLQVATPLPQLEPGSTMLVRDGILSSDSGIMIDFNASPIWKPPTFPTEKALPFSSLPALTLKLYHYIMERLQPVGLGILIPDILAINGDRNTTLDKNLANISVKSAWPLIEKIIRAGLQRDFRSLLDNAHHLVGLGEGLTPSGDDFLGGFFFCLHQLAYLYPKAPDRWGWNYSDFIRTSKPLTNLISFTFLNDHSQGYGMEPLHLFANDLFTGEPTEQGFLHASKLVAVGHSTGWDILTGFLAGMCIAFPP